LTGFWTRQGSDEIHARAALVMQALAQSKLLPVLDTQLQRLPELRQSHWLQWLLALSHEGFHVDGSQSRQALLMDIDRGNSPAMRLARVMHEDLADLNDAQAQPWLQELRYLQQLQQQATQAVYLGKLSRLDQKLRQKTASVLKNTGGATPRAFNPSMAASWLAWRSSERHATAAALAAPEKSLMLIGGLFAPQDTPTDNVIRQMYSRFEQLRQSISPERDDYAINVLWALYQSDADLLLAHAINSAACEVQQRWQQQVLWPLTNNNQQQTPDDPFMLASQSVQNFMRGTAKGLLDMTQGEAQAARFRGQALPLTPEFLSLVNHVLRPDDVLATPLSTESKNQDELARLDEQQKTLIAQKTALESQSVDVTLNSQPATVPGMARIMPTGTKLTLTCDDQSVTLASMNFSEQARFHWRPAHCSHVELVIRFPQFDLHYDYLGDAAWPNFLRDFSQGQHTFAADDFDDQQTQLRALGISNILVRYQLSDWAPTQQAWGLWQQTTEQLNQTNEQRAALQNAQAQRQQSRLTGNLSQVPTTVAQCSN
jgi:type VI secretion system protein ImpL